MWLHRPVGSRGEPGTTIQGKGATARP